MILRKENATRSRAAQSEVSGLLTRGGNKRKESIYITEELKSEVQRLADLYDRSWNAVMVELIRMGADAHYRLHPEDHPDAIPASGLTKKKK